MKYLVAVALLAAGCSSQRSASPGDAGIPDSATLDAANDAAADASPDAPPDAACPQAGAPTLISIATPPLTAHAQLTGNGTSTMAVWNAGSHTVWAQYDGGGVVGHGDTGGLQGMLLAVGSQFVMWDWHTLATFDGTTWSAHTFEGYLHATSGSSLGAIDGDNVVLFDGTTVIGPTQITQHFPLGIGGDGSGGFAVVTSDANSGAVANLGLITYDGTSWSSEATIGTASEGSSYFLDTTVVPYNGSWAVMWNVDGTVNIAIDVNGTWTRRSFSGTGSVNYAMAVNGDSLAVVGNAGFAATYKNSAWSRHDLTTAVANDGEPPWLQPFGSGFVAVYGSVDLRGAIYNGTSWGSPVLFTSRDGSRDVRIATTSDTIAVGFVDNSAAISTFSPEVSVFHGGAWGTASLVGTGQSRSVDAPSVGVESDGIRTAYIEPGTAETMLEVGGTWSAPDDMPVAPIFGEVLSAAIARAANGHELIAWEQVDAEQIGLFAAEHDGDQWSAPVLLDTARYQQGPMVATTGSIFEIGWDYGPDETGYPVAGGRLARWTGSGIAPVTQTAPITSLAAGDSTFVYFSGSSTAGGARLSWSTSTDGDHWAYPTTLPADENMLVALAGGRAGVVAMTRLDSSSALQARVWHGGAWSATATLGTGYSPCLGAVGTSTAAAICVAQATVQPAVYANGAWTYPPVNATAAIDTPYELATDGTDYRLDMGTSSGVESSVLHNGAWSPLVTAPGVAIPDSVTASCGTWVGASGPQHEVVSATGVGAYMFAHATGIPAAAHVVPAGDRLDAFWIAPTSSSLGQAVLQVQLGL